MANDNDTTYYGFGVCPVCRKEGHYINVYKSHWFLCDEHRKRWCPGYNLFSSWMNETEEDWKRNARRLEAYEECEPYMGEDLIAPNGNAAPVTATLVADDGPNDLDLVAEEGLDQIHSSDLDDFPLSQEDGEDSSTARSKGAVTPPPRPCSPMRAKTSRWVDKRPARRFDRSYWAFGRQVFGRIKCVPIFRLHVTSCPRTPHFEAAGAV